MPIQRPQDQYVKVGNINTRFWTAGDKGTSVILVHGLGAFIEYWERNINHLAINHRVYALDLVGFGRSDKLPAMLNTSFLVQFINNFMEVQRIDNASIVGNSMGGMLALMFALKYPDKLRKLVIEDAGGIGKEVSLNLRLLSLPLLGEMVIQPSRRLAARFLNNMVYDPAMIPDEMIELFYQYMAQPGGKKCLLTMERNMFNFFGRRSYIVNSILNNLPTIKAPTLVIWGKQDNISSAAHAHLAAEKIPNCSLKIFDRCGHIPHFEHVEEFNDVVLKFLAE
jgi:4,5:9,10-diseco-3-hydroxy-5,9,17-trioxoandrosta-1(10),2-diene-4-oate hydrolase